jgi:polyhydroxyalkanoate synthesis regulator phasin
MSNDLHPAAYVVTAFLHSDISEDQLKDSLRTMMGDREAADLLAGALATMKTELDALVPRLEALERQIRELGRA